MLPPSRKTMRPAFLLCRFHARACPGLPCLRAGSARSAGHRLPWRRARRETRHLPAAPALASKAGKIPVFVWIHGGGLVSGYKGNEREINVGTLPASAGLRGRVPRLHTNGRITARVCPASSRSATLLLMLPDPLPAPPIFEFLQWTMNREESKRKQVFSLKY